MKFCCIYFLVLLLFADVLAQRRAPSKPETSETTSSPRSRSRGRTRFTATPEYSQAIETSSEETNSRRLVSRKRVDSAPLSDRRLHHASSSKNYAVEEIIDEVPVEPLRKVPRPRVLTETRFEAQNAPNTPEIHLEPQQPKKPEHRFEKSHIVQKNLFEPISPASDVPSTSDDPSFPPTENFHSSSDAVDAPNLSTAPTHLTSEETAVEPVKAEDEMHREITRSSPRPKEPSRNLEAHQRPQASRGGARSRNGNAPSRVERPNEHHAPVARVIRTRVRKPDEGSPPTRTVVHRGARRRPEVGDTPTPPRRGPSVFGAEEVPITRSRTGRKIPSASFKKMDNAPEKITIDIDASVRSSEAPKSTTSTTEAATRRRTSSRFTSEVTKPRFRSRSRATPPIIDEQKLEVLPLFESENKIVKEAPLKTRYSPRRRNPNSASEESVETSATENEVRRTSKPTTTTLRVTSPTTTLRVISPTTTFSTSRITSPITSAARTTRTRTSLKTDKPTQTPTTRKHSVSIETKTESSVSFKRKSNRKPKIIKESVISEVTEVTSKRTIGRGSKRPTSGVLFYEKDKKKKEAKVLSARHKAGEGAINTKKNELTSSEEEIDDSDNYPEPFKALIQAKKKQESRPTPASSGTKSPPRRVVTSSEAAKVASTAPPKPVAAPSTQLPKEEDSENELFPKSTTPLVKPSRKTFVPTKSRKGDNDKETSRKGSLPTRRPLVARSTGVPVPITSKEPHRFHAKFASPTKSEVTGTTPSVKTEKKTSSLPSRNLYAAKKAKDDGRASYRGSKKHDVDLKTSQVPNSISQKKTPRYSSRYRGEHASRTPSRTTSSPVYIPTIPPFRSTTIPVKFKVEKDLGLEVITFDDPTVTVHSANLINGDYIASTSEKNDPSHPNSLASKSATQEKTTEKAVSIIERIINSITAISTTVGPIVENTTQTSTTTVATTTKESAILKLATKKYDKSTNDVLDKTVVQPLNSSTSEKPTTVIQKILNSLSALQAETTTTEDVYKQVGSNFNTVSSLVTTPMSRGSKSASSSLSFAPSSTINPLSVFDEISEEQILQKRTIGELLELLNSLTTSAPDAQTTNVVIVTPKFTSTLAKTTPKLMSSSLVVSQPRTDTSTRFSLMTTTTTDEPTTVTMTPAEKSPEIKSENATTEMPMTTSAEPTTTLADSARVVNESNKVTEFHELGLLPLIFGSGGLNPFEFTTVTTPTEYTESDTFYTFPSTLPTLSTFNVSPDSVAIFSANDLSNFITPDDLDTTVTIMPAKTENPLMTTTSTTPVPSTTTLTTSTPVNNTSVDTTMSKTTTMPTTSVDNNSMSKMTTMPTISLDNTSMTKMTTMPATSVDNSMSKMTTVDKSSMPKSTTMSTTADNSASKMTTTDNSMSKMTTTDNSMSKMTTADNSMSKMTTADNSMSKITTADNSMSKMTTVDNSMSKMTTADMPQMSTTPVVPSTSSNVNKTAPNNQMDNTTPLTPDPDYFVFAVLNNNTILRKKPRVFPAKDTPFVIVGIYPNNTVVRKFPNGTLVPMEPVIRVRGFDTRQNPPPLPEITSNQVTLDQGNMTDNKRQQMVDTKNSMVPPVPPTMAPQNSANIDTMTPKLSVIVPSGGMSMSDMAATTEAATLRMLDMPTTQKPNEMHPGPANIQHMMPLNGMPRGEPTMMPNGANDKMPMMPGSKMAGSITKSPMMASNGAKTPMMDIVTAKMPMMTTVAAKTPMAPDVMPNSPPSVMPKTPMLAPVAAKTPMAPNVMPKTPMMAPVAAKTAPNVVPKSPPSAMPKMPMMTTVTAKTPMAITPTDKMPVRMMKAPDIPVSKERMMSKGKMVADVPNSRNGMNADTPVLRDSAAVSRSGMTPNIPVSRSGMMTDDPVSSGGMMAPISKGTMTDVSRGKMMSGSPGSKDGMMVGAPVSRGGMMDAPISRGGKMIDTPVSKGRMMTVPNNPISKTTMMPIDVGTMRQDDFASSKAEMAMSTTTLSPTTTLPSIIELLNGRTVQAFNKLVNKTEPIYRTLDVDPKIPPTITANPESNEIVGSSPTKPSTTMAPTTTPTIKTTLTARHQVPITKTPTTTRPTFRATTNFPSTTTFFPSFFSTIISTLGPLGITVPPRVVPPITTPPPATTDSGMDSLTAQSTERVAIATTPPGGTTSHRGTRVSVRGRSGVVRGEPTTVVYASDRTEPTEPPLTITPQRAAPTSPTSMETTTKKSNSRRRTTTQAPKQTRSRTSAAATTAPPTTTPYETTTRQVRTTTPAPFTSQILTTTETVTTTKKAKRKELTEQQKKDLETIRQLEREQAEILQQLSFLTSLNLNGFQPTPDKNNLANRIIALAMDRDKDKQTTTGTTTTTTTKKPKTTTEPILPTKIQKDGSIDIDELVRQLNQKGIAVTPPSKVPSTYGTSNDAIIAALLKEQGIGPSTPKILADQIKQAGVFEEHPTTRKPRTTTTQRVPGARLMQGLNWLFNAFAPPPTTTKKPKRRTRPKPKPKPSTEASEEMLANQPTHITPIVTPAPKKEAKNPNSLSQAEIKKLIKQLETIQKDPNSAKELDLTALKHLKGTKNREVEVITSGTNGATSRSTTRAPRKTSKKHKGKSLKTTTDAAIATVSNSILDDYEEFSTSTRKPRPSLPPLQLRPVAGVDDEDSNPRVRGQLVTAAVNVTRAISSFLGTAFQEAAQQISRAISSGSGSFRNYFTRFAQASAGTNHSVALRE